MQQTKNNVEPILNTPTHIAYQVREREGKKAIWTRIGAGWLHRDDRGLAIVLNSLPPDGRITLRVPFEPKE